MIFLHELHLLINILWSSWPLRNLFKYHFLFLDIFFIFLFFIFLTFSCSLLQQTWARSSWPQQKGFLTSFWSYKLSAVEICWEKRLCFKAIFEIDDVFYFRRFWQLVTFRSHKDRLKSPQEFKLVRNIGLCLHKFVKDAFSLKKAVDDIMKIFLGRDKNWLLKEWFLNYFLFFS